MKKQVYTAVVVAVKEDEEKIIDYHSHFLAKNPENAKNAILLNIGMAESIRAAQADGYETEVLVRPFCG